MKRIIITFFFVWVAINSYAQKVFNTFEEFMAEPAKMAGEYYIDSFEGPQTPSPKGYKPVYISHFGRHGARYALGDDFYERVHNFLVKAHSDEALTEVGEDLYRRYEAFYPFVKYRGGDLTMLGQRQHREIARKMYLSYPSVFKGKTFAVATSTLVPRVIMSMAAFMDELDDLDKSFECCMDTGRSYLDVLDPDTEDAPNFVPVSPMTQEAKDSYSALLSELIDIEGIASRFFREYDYVEKNYGSWRFISNLRTLIISMPCLDLPSLDSQPEERFDHFLTKEELFNLWEMRNYGGYVSWGRSPYNDGSFLDRIHYLVEDIVSWADEDMLSGKVNLRLRFGHDSGIFALAGRLGINNFGAVIEDPHDVKNIWRCTEVPMASNIQFIFYRRKAALRRPGSTLEDDILFKVLMNGREATLPMEAVEGPYYSWNEFKKTLSLSK